MSEDKNQAEGQPLNWETRDEIAVLTLTRPQAMNSFDLELMAEHRKRLEEFEADDELRVLIYTGEGRAFSTGIDIKKAPDFLYLDPRVRTQLWVTPNSLKINKPTIAAINGFALGGGLEMALACDLRVAASHAKLGLTETSLAIIPGAGGTQRLPAIVGKSRAKDLILTARRLNATEAEVMGLVNRVAPEGELHEAALELAESIAANGPVAIRAAKAAIDQGSEHPLQEGLEIEARCYERVLPTRDRVEALEAFAEKPKPQFTGE